SIRYEVYLGRCLGLRYCAAVLLHFSHVVYTQQSRLGGYQREQNQSAQRSVALRQDIRRHFIGEDVVVVALTFQRVERGNVLRRLTVYEGFPCQARLEARTCRIFSHGQAQEALVGTLEQTGIGAVGGHELDLGHSAMSMDRLDLHFRSNVLLLAHFVPQDGTDHGTSVGLLQSRQFAFVVLRAQRTVHPQQVCFSFSRQAVVVFRHVQ